MSLSQWTKPTDADSGSNMTESESATNKIEGGFSLRWIGVAGNRGMAARLLTTGAGITTGKIRTACHLAAYDTSGIELTNTRFGVGAMLQTSISSANTLYALQCRYVSGTDFPSTAKIVKTQTRSIPTDTDLATVSTGITMTAGTTFTFELKWQFDSGGVQMLLTAAFGTAVDFSNLAAVGNFTDGSPFTSGVSAGIYASQGNVDPALDLSFDYTQIFKP